MNRRIGAYVLTGDPTWLASSLSRYYDLLDELVVLVPSNGLSWAGRSLPVEACLDAVRSVDRMKKARIVRGEWTDVDSPLHAENAQRQCGIDNLADMDWILQLDNDELLSDSAALLDAISRAEVADVRAVEWPMRVLFRDLGAGRFLQVVDRDGGPRFEYPGPIAVRPGTALVDCRRTSGAFLRPTVHGDSSSPQVNRPCEPGEVRVAMLAQRTAITHNSWGRSPSSVWRKIHSSAHQTGWRGSAYFLVVWLPAPLTWRLLRNFHLILRNLWPRLGPYSIPSDLLVADDVSPLARSRQTKRLA